MVNKEVISAAFDGNEFTITMTIEKFNELWDSSYAELAEYPIHQWSESMGLNCNYIDLNSFVAEQVLSVLDSNGKEDESVGNECFENYDAENCVIKSVSGSVIIISGCLSKF